MIQDRKRHSRHLFWLSRSLLMKRMLFVSLFWALFFGCSASPKIRNISELFPPRNIRVYLEDRGYKVVWDPSIDENHPGFGGYNLYYGTSSLSQMLVDDLPLPIVLDKTAHEYFLSDLSPATQYFLHIRSRNAKGDLSLPSLPEITISTTATF